MFLSENINTPQPSPKNLFLSIPIIVVFEEQQGQDKQTQREDLQPCAKRPRTTTDAPDPVESGVTNEHTPTSVKVWLGVASNGVLPIGEVKACTNGTLEKGAVKHNPNDSEIKTVGSARVRVQGRLTDYWRKGLNTSEPESLASIALKGDPELSPEEELSSVPKENIDSLKLVDAD